MVTTEDLVRRSPSVGRDRTPHHTPPRRLHGAPDRQSALGPTDVQMAQSGTSSFTARAKRAGGSDNARQRWSRRLVAGAFAFAAWAVPADQMRDWISPQRERSVAPTAVIRRSYEHLLHRPVEVGDGNHFVKLAYGPGGLAEALVAFYSTDEVTARLSTVGNREFVLGLYEVVEGREADYGGFHHWMTELDSGVAREAVVRAFTNAVIGNVPSD